MILAGFVELVWDPLSSQQSNNLTTLCKRIQDDYSVFDGEQSKPVKVLLYYTISQFYECILGIVLTTTCFVSKAFVEAVIQRLRTAVDNDVFVPLYPKK